MLQELQANALSGHGRDGADNGKIPDKMKSGAENRSIHTASALRLPSSDEDLEDFSSDSYSDAEDRALIRPTPRRRLLRLDQGGNVAKSQPDDDLLNGIASLGLGPAAARRPLPGVGAAIHSIAIPAKSEDDASDSASEADSAKDKGKDASSDEDEAPFYERLAPSVAVTAKASAADSSAPEPGALVLGEQKQFVLARPVAQNLYPHQVQGVTWLWNLYAMKCGGILGDDMGLGKTMQCSAFLAGLFGSQLVSRAIIIAPKTLIPHWIKELGVCGLRSQTREFFGSESERSAALRQVAGNRGIIVTTYGMVQHNSEQLARPAHSRADCAFTWDVMFLDEGHKIKNPKMKLVEHLHKLPARVRVIISGTPIQNNLMEMHSLFDFTTPGLLSDAKTFKKNYERPITKGLDKEASARERQTGAAIAAELRQRVEPFFLRREKKDVLTGSNSNEGASTSNSAAGSAPQIGQRARTLPRKNDLVVWVRLTPLQRKIYTAFLHTDSVRQVLNEKASPLAAITVLKKICDHPALLSKRAASSVISGAHRWASNDGGARRGDRRQDSDDFIACSDEEDETGDGDSSGDEGRSTSDGGFDELPAEWLGDAAAMDSELARELDQRGAEASCKTAFVLKLLERLHAEGHRTLIFSQSKVMLSILEAGVKAMKLAYCRIDGDVSSAEERQAHVQRFQTSNIPVFLLTSQVGGLGLTLTAADRVIIVDPAWNPSVDDQSVDRAYRMGQTRDVVVYRLITCGTVEEKIYRRQVFKGGLFKTGTEEGIQFRYFTQTELRDLFAVTTEGLQSSITQAQLHEMHAHQRNASEEVQRHLEQVLCMDSVAGVHDHNLLFTQRPEEPAPSAKEGAAILSQMSGAGLVGVDALTDMLGKGLKLGGRAEDVKRQAVLSQLRGEIAACTNRIRSTEVTMCQMPDRGARLQESLREMRARREALINQVALLEGRDPAAPGADAMPGVAQACKAAPPGGSQGPLSSQPSRPQPVSSQPSEGKIGGRVFGGGLVSRSRESTDSATADSVRSHGAAEAPRAEQRQQHVGVSSSPGDHPSSSIDLTESRASDDRDSSRGSLSSQPQAPTGGKVGGRVFGRGLMARTSGGGRDSTDSASHAPMPQQNPAAPPPAQQQQRECTSSSSQRARSSSTFVDAEDASFITASSAGGHVVDDDATSNVIDLTSTP